MPQAIEINRVILITGAASGIGAAIVRRLAGPGVGLILHTGSSEADLQRCADAATAAGSEVATVLGDLRTDDTCTRLADTAAERFGRLDAVISNAGYADRTPFTQLDEPAVDRAYETMTRAFFRLAHATLPMLRDSKQARVVAISSFVAHRYREVGEVFPASAAAKAGLEALAKSLALELAPDGITVNCVVPGHVEKDRQSEEVRATRRTRMAPLIPMGRLAQPDDISGIVGFLLSPEASYITGQLIHVDGGLTL